jgi:hypothetical protein
MNKLVILLAICISVSCKTTQVTSSWVKPDTSTTNFNNISVLAIVGEANRHLQQHMEAAVAAELQKRGYKATSYFAQHGPQALAKTDEQAAIAMMGKDGAEAILTIVLLDTAKEHRYVPESVTYYPAGYYNRFWGYYVTLYDRIYAPGYYTTNTRYFWETNLYRANNQELIYSVSTEAFDPGSADDHAEQYAEVIVRDMVRNGVIARRR